MNIDEINELLSKKQDLEDAQCEYAMEEILNGRLRDEQLGTFITLLHEKGERANELASLVGTMWANSPKLDLDVRGTLDTCGTGGDKSNTFNISTAVALLLSAAGVKIAKHGNRAASSKCGAADVLEALHIPVDLSVEAVVELFEETGFTFLFAPTFHPGMRFAGPVRKSLGVPTTFNYLGPLANPFHAPFRMHGVSLKRMVPIYVDTLRELGVERALVFHGHSGLDELSLSGPNEVYKLVDGNISQDVIDPSGLGFESADISELVGGDAKENANIISEIVSGKKGPKRDVVVLNAAAALTLVRDIGFDEAIAVVCDVIDSGNFKNKIGEISQCAQRLAQSKQ